MSFAVIMMGHAVSGKTTSAYGIAPALGAAVISTSTLGHFVPDRTVPDFFCLRDARYQRAVSIARLHLLSGGSIVLDGTYALRRWRAQIFKLLAREGVEDIVVVTCRCSDTSEISRRLAERIANPHLPDAAASTPDVYWGSLGEIEPFAVEEVPRGIRLGAVAVDTFSKTVAVEVHSAVAARVASALAAFPGNSIRRPVLVTLEGIGGSGKSTQLERLRARLGRDPRFAFDAEFSQTPLGEWIEESRRGGLRVMRQVGAMSAHAIAALDWTLRSAVAPGDPEFVVQDTGWRSRIAHAATIQDESVRSPQWSQIVAAMKEGMQRMTHVQSAGERILFLDCPAELAAARVCARHGSLAPGDETFLGDLAAAYAELVEPSLFVTHIDARASIDDVSAAVDRCLAEWGVA